MPLFLWSLLAGAAASIPIALHLLHRRKPKPVPFSSLRFLYEAVAKTRRSRHLTNVFTLLMRVLIMILLVFAFKQDKVRFAWIPEGKRTVVIILDASASMRYQDGETTCFSKASEWALNLVRSLDEEDRVAVLMPGLSEPRLIFPPISDHETVSRALQHAEPGYGASNLVEQLNDLVARLEEEYGTSALEFHVFSDFQKAGWNEEEAEGLNEQLTKREILLFLNHVQPIVTANAGLAKAFFYPPAILGDGDFQAKAHVRSSAEYSGGNTLRLFVQDKEQNQKPFRLLPDQTVTEIVGGVAEGEAKYVLGQLELDDDALMADNVFRFCLPRLPGIPVLLVDGSGQNNVGFRETPFLRHAIQPKGKARTLFLPKTVDWDTFKAGGEDESHVLFVCNPPVWDAAVLDKLKTFVRDGGTVVLMPGQHEALETSIEQIPSLKGIRVRKEVLPQEKPMAIVPSEKPAELEKKLLGIMPPPSALVMRRRLIFTELPDTVSMVFQYHDGGAFMLCAPFGQGTFWVTSVGANRDWSEWPLTPFFVVIQQELIKSSASRNMVALSAEVGGMLALDWAEDATELDFRLRTPSGQEEAMSLSRPSATKPVVIRGFDEPGFFHLQRNGKERVIAVNTPEEETGLTYSSPEELGLPLRTTRLYQADSWHEHQQNLTNLHHGRPLWPFLLCCAFVLAISEEFFANLRSRASGLPDTLLQFMRRGGRAA